MKSPVYLLLLLVHLLTIPSGLAQEVYLKVLGIAQDGGAPHINCEKKCCEAYFRQGEKLALVSSLGVIDVTHQKTYLFDATPDLPQQLAALNEERKWPVEQPVSGVFLTHAHIGHYTGLQYFGREAMHASGIKTYTMPRMYTFLQENAPWNQLLELENIQLIPLANQKTVTLSPALTVTPFRVPHRDEFSETVGFTIRGPEKSVLFIPDIDKWEKWEVSITEAIAEVDYAFLDATFYDAAEVSHRSLSEIPHPLVVESMILFEPLSREERAKIHFIHLNHTNPMLDTASAPYKQVIKQGYQVAGQGDILKL
jgi:pyrroloquinoline quinone biosynthesis protein B